MTAGNWKQVGVIKATAWTCARCRHENKPHTFECGLCGHEPTAGRRDTTPEGRRYDPERDGEP